MNNAMKLVAKMLLVLPVAVACAQDMRLENPSCFAIDLEGDEAQAALDAIDAWHPHPIEIDIQIGGSCKNRIGYASDSDPYWKGPTHRAYTKINHDASGARTETHIRLNPEFPWNECRMRETLTHEFGHALGIEGHSADEDSIMSATIAGCSGNEVTQDDHDHVHSIY